MTDPVKQILIDMPYDDYRTDDVYELITDKIRQQIGQELLAEENLYEDTLINRFFISKETVVKVCKLDK